MTDIFTCPSLFCRKMITNWFGGDVQKRPKPEGNTWPDKVWEECETRRVNAIERRNSRGGICPEPIFSSFASQEDQPGGITLISSEKNQIKSKP